MYGWLACYNRWFIMGKELWPKKSKIYWRFRLLSNWYYRTFILVPVVRQRRLHVLTLWRYKLNFSNTFELFDDLFVRRGPSWKIICQPSWPYTSVCIHVNNGRKFPEGETHWAAQCRMLAAFWILRNFHRDKWSQDGERGCSDVLHTSV